MTLDKGPAPILDPPINPSDSDIRMSNLTPNSDSASKTGQTGQFKFVPNYSTDNSGRRVSPRNQPPPTPVSSLPATITPPNQPMDVVMAVDPPEAHLSVPVEVVPVAPVVSAPVAPTPSATFSPVAPSPSSDIVIVQAPSPLPSASERLTILASTLRMHSNDYVVLQVAEALSALSEELTIPSPPAALVSSPPTIDSLAADITIIKSLMSELTAPKPPPLLSYKTILGQQSIDVVEYMNDWTGPKRPKVPVRPTPPPSKPYAVPPKSRLVRNPYAPLDNHPESSPPRLSDEERRRVFGHDRPDPGSESPLTAVAILGIHRPLDCGPRFIADCLFHEFGFPSRNIYNVHCLGDGLSELVIPSSSVPELQAALSGSSVELYPVYDPTVPLTQGVSHENARHLFNNRVTSTIDRLKSVNMSPRMVRLSEFFGRYRNYGSTSIIPVSPVIPRQEHYRHVLTSMNCSDPAMETEQFSSDPVQGSEQ